MKRREVKSKGEKERYSHLFQNFPQFIVIHTVKGFGIVNMFFWNSCFSDDPVDVGNLISGSSAFSKTSFNIPYDYTVEVRNRFKGLDPIDRVPDELWTEVHDIVQETGIKTIPMEKKCQKAK